MGSIRTQDYGYVASKSPYAMLTWDDNVNYISNTIAQIKIAAAYVLRLGGSINTAKTRTINGSVDGIGYSFSFTMKSTAGTYWVGEKTIEVSRPAYGQSPKSIAITMSSSIPPSINWGGSYGSGNAPTAYLSIAANPVNPVRTPGAPTNFIAKFNADNNISLSWVNHPNNGGIANHRIDVQKDDGDYILVENSSSILSGSTTSYTYAKGEANSRYRFRIQSGNQAGASSFTYSNYIYTTPAKPSVIKAYTTADSSSKVYYQTNAIGVKYPGIYRWWLNDTRLDSQKSATFTSASDQNSVAVEISNQDQTAWSELVSHTPGSATVLPICYIKNDIKFNLITFAQEALVIPLADNNNNAFTSATARQPVLFYGRDKNSYLWYCGLGVQYYAPVVSNIDTDINYLTDELQLIDLSIKRASPILTQQFSSNTYTTSNGAVINTINKTTQRWVTLFAASFTEANSAKYSSLVAMLNDYVGSLTVNGNISLNISGAETMQRFVISNFNVDVDCSEDDPINHTTGKMPYIAIEETSIPSGLYINVTGQAFTGPKDDNMIYDVENLSSATPVKAQGWWHRCQYIQDETLQSSNQQYVFGLNIRVSFSDITATSLDDVHCNLTGSCVPYILKDGVVEEDKANTTEIDMQVDFLTVDTLTRETGVFRLTVPKVDGLVGYNVSHIQLASDSMEKNLVLPDWMISTEQIRGYL